MFIAELVSGSELLKSSCKELIEKHLSDKILVLPFDVDAKIDFFTFKDDIIKKKELAKTSDFFDIIVKLNNLTYKTVNTQFRNENMGVVFETGPMFGAIEGISLLYLIWKNKLANKKEMADIVERYKTMVHDICALWSPLGIDCFIYLPSLYKQHTKETITEFFYFLLSSLLKEDINLVAVPFRFLEEELGCDFLKECFTIALSNFFILYDIMYINVGKKGDLIEFLVSNV